MARTPQQLRLSLRERRGWGGRRERAGRKRPSGQPERVAHVARGDLTRPLPAHVTLRMCDDVPSLRTVPIVLEIERTFAVACARRGFRLVHYSLQDNHAHLVVEARSKDALARGMKAVAARLARAVNRIAGRKGRVLADRYHVRLLPTPREVHNALRYVLLNARRHAAKAGSKLRGPVRLDPASSSHWFEGWKYRVPSDASAARAHLRPVARAKTWLLAVGWRRHGLLDPADVPG